MKILKTVVSYISLLAILLLYTFFLDGDSGTIMLAFFIFVPLISLILTLIARRNISAQLLCKETMTEKNSELSYRIILKKRTLFPVPFIIAVTEVSPHFYDKGEDTVKVSMSVKKGVSFEKSVSSVFCGNGKIILKAVYISDYLNLFTFRVRNVSDICSVNILPEIHEINSAGTVFRAVSDVMRNDENDDESENSSMFGMAAFPGYEHREYIPGDPLKRINWKLSSKKNKYMVRLDEKISSVRPSIVLDLSQCRENNSENTAAREHLIEGCLSFMNFCIEQGLECSFSYYENSQWYTEMISSQSDIEDIAVKVSVLPDISDKNHFPDEIIYGNGITVSFIQKYSPETENAVCTAIQSGGSIFTVVSEKTPYVSENLWYMNGEFEIKEMQTEDTDYD